MDRPKPILGITMGDPAGIGPEIAIKTLSDPSVYTKCRPLLVGSIKVLEAAAKNSKLPITVHAIDSVEAADFKPGNADVMDIHGHGISEFRTGEISAVAGDMAFRTVVKTIELALDGKIDGTVTGPINKESIHLAGHNYSGHTEIYAHYTDTKKYAMLLVEGNLRVIHVSTHVSLREACDLVKKERIIETIELMDDACRTLGIKNPKIGVAGLNPHASDGGLFGNEEEREIVPAISYMSGQGYQVEGPIPADTLFPKVIGGVYDGCVVMYHDQGHIPFKVIGFQWDSKTRNMKSVRGVNITLGLPIIRTSVDHGTAMEIAGKGIASADAMGLAIDYAIKLYKNKKNSKA